MRRPVNTKEVVYDNISFITSSYSGNTKKILIKYSQNKKLNRFFIQTPEVEIRNIYTIKDITVIITSPVERQNNECC